MARTKADRAKKAGGKSSNKADVLRPTSSGRSSGSVKKSTGAPPPEEVEYIVVDLEAEEESRAVVDLEAEEESRAVVLEEEELSEEGEVRHQESKGEGPLTPPVSELVHNPVAVLLDQESKTDKSNEEIADADEVPIDGFSNKGKVGSSSAAGAPPSEEVEYEVVDLEAEEEYRAVELEEGELRHQESEGEGSLTSSGPELVHNPVAVVLDSVSKDNEEIKSDAEIEERIAECSSTSAEGILGNSFEKNDVNGNNGHVMPEQ